MVKISNLLISFFVAVPIIVGLYFYYYFRDTNTQIDVVKDDSTAIVTDTDAVKPPETELPPLSPIYFTGDVMLGRYVESLLKKDSIRPWDFINLFASSSAVVINFESAMADPHVATLSGGMRFSVSGGSLSILKSLNVSTASLANNHSRDYGLEGRKEAQTELAKINITAFGDAVTFSSSSVSYLDYGTDKIALIAIHTLFSPPTLAQLETVINEANEHSTYQIVYVHWGDEYQAIHNSQQAKLAENLERLGVDLVVGHHPHVTQDIQMINKMPVFYSLGNFIFDQYFSTAVKEGFVLSLVLTSKQATIGLYPHYQCSLSTPCLMPTAMKTPYLKTLADRSDANLRPQIMAQTLVFQR